VTYVAAFEIPGVCLKKKSNHPKSTLQKEREKKTTHEENDISFSYHMKCKH